MEARAYVYTDNLNQKYSDKRISALVLAEVQRRNLPRIGTLSGVVLDTLVVLPSSTTPGQNTAHPGTGASRQRRNRLEVVPLLPPQTMPPANLAAYEPTSSSAPCCQEATPVNNDTDQAAIPSHVVGFSLATPNTGPEQTPSYVNFSPLFTSTPQQCNGIQQPIPINLTSNSVMMSPRLEALAAVASSASNQLQSSIFSPPALYSITQSASAEYETQYPRANIDDPHAALPFAITPQRNEMSIMERYQRYADEHRSELDVGSSNKRRKVFEHPDDTSSQVWALPAQQTFAEEYQSNLSQPAVILNDQKSSDENSAALNQRMTPKTKVPVGAGGSSCHQCKNRREANQLNFCRNRIRYENNPKRKICRKKFCDHCLVKFRYSHILPRKDVADWECPSCQGICVCAACKRKADPTAQLRPELLSKGPQEYAVSMSFAHKLLTDPALFSQNLPSDTL